MQRVLLLAALICLKFSVPLYSAELPTARSPMEVGVAADKLANVKELMRQHVKDDKVAGVVTIVARRGKIVFFEAAGKQDIAANVPMATDSIFRIYSMSKPITSVAAMILADEGKLDLDAPVANYLPELKGLEVYAKGQGEQLETVPAAREMAVRDLLRHTSGLTYGFFGDTEVDKQYRRANVLNPETSLSEVPARLGKIPLLYQPGTRFNYSVSSDVLGRVVEVVAETSLDHYFHYRILKPLGMNDTGFHVPDAKLDRFAANYGPAEGGLKVIDDPRQSRYRKPPKLLSGGGGMVSTARDYMRFCQMLLNGGELDGVRLLKAETVKSMTRNQLPKEAYPITLNGPREGVGFGLGFSVIVEKTDYTSLCHLGEYGWGGAASTHFWISPQDELAVVVLTQRMPFTFQMETAIKPVVYDALLE